MDQRRTNAVTLLSAVVRSGCLGYCGCSYSIATVSIVVSMEVWVDCHLDHSRGATVGSINQTLSTRGWKPNWGQTQSLWDQYKPVWRQKLQYVDVSAAPTRTRTGGWQFDEFYFLFCHLYRTIKLSKMKGISSLWPYKTGKSSIRLLAC